jgi:tetratricopeptide (TPR) repeat protein
MTLIRLWGHCRLLQRATLVAPLLAMLAVSGCAQMNKLKSRIGGQAPHTSTEVTPAAAPAVAEAPVGSSLTAIVNSELQRGHYAAGEKALRRYLTQHPGDRSAQAMLRQLTTDPVRMLGRPSRTYVVQAGDSYSTLAARYLGDSSRFLILARYNGSTNPSVLRVGETVHLPLPAAGASLRLDVAPPGADGIERHATAGAAPAVAPTTTPVAEAPAEKARRLQKESLVLLDQGHKEQALARLGAALAIDPQLKPAGTAEAASLRGDLLASYHQRAIVLYRDQQLDQAIALWDRVLAIDPGYEPAMIYRTRALELKRRLGQF